MAQRRMFSKSITNSSRFLMMPQSSQNLYFHLGMNADDDGFCEHFAIMRMTDSKPDDLKVLQAKGFAQVFDDRVLIIADWKENNYLRSDRYTPSKYLEIYKEELKQLSSGIPDGDQRYPQVRLGKVRIGKVNNIATEVAGVKEVINSFKEINPSYETLFKNKTERSAAERLIKKYTLQGILGMIERLHEVNTIPYMPISITPYQLEKNIGKIKAKLEQQGQTKNKGIVDIRK